jgi:adenylate kinase
METAEQTRTQLRTPPNGLNRQWMASVPLLQPNRIIVFLGAPGSGKGTQSSMLATRLGISCVSTGEMLRHAAKQDTDAGLRLRRIMETGGLVDDGTVCDAVVARIQAFHAECRSPSAAMILDGFPRNVAQAKKLSTLLESLRMPGPLVLHLEVPNAILLSRLARRKQCAKCGATYGSGPNTQRCQVDGSVLVEREDDSRSIVEKRLAAYEKETLPLVDFYRANEFHNGTYRRIDGSLGAAEIAKGVCDIVSFGDAPLAA